MHSIKVLPNWRFNADNNAPHVFQLTWVVGSYPTLNGFSMASSHTVKVKSVLFNGSKHDLKALLLQWNSLQGVDLDIAANDYVGGSFDVSFTRREGAITQREADEWVAQALRHAAE